MGWFACGYWLVWRGGLVAVFTPWWYDWIGLVVCGFARCYSCICRLLKRCLVALGVLRYLFGLVAVRVLLLFLFVGARCIV